MMIRKIPISKIPENTTKNKNDRLEIFQSGWIFFVGRRTVPSVDRQSHAPLGIDSDGNQRNHSVSVADFDSVHR
jgi:hypothetical protein